MKFKNTGAQKSTITRNVDDFVSKTENIFQAVSVMAKRSSQVNQKMKDELMEKLQEYAISQEQLDEVFENQEQIAVSKFYESLPKPWAIAMKELLNDELYMRDANASEDEDFMLQTSVFGEKRPQEGQIQIGTVIMSNSNYAVYSVDESVYGVPETIPQEERDEARNQLNQQSGFSDYAALISELAMRAEISRNEEIISSSSLFD